MNTARAFGPAVISGFTTDHWVYWVGPGLGGLLGAFIFHLLKFSQSSELSSASFVSKLKLNTVHYYDLNPGQDAHEEKDSPDLYDSMFALKEKPNHI